MIVVVMIIVVDSVVYNKVNVTRSRGMSHMSTIFNFDFLKSTTCPIKMLHFDPNTISIGHLVAEIWIFFEVPKQ